MALHSNLPSLPAFDIILQGRELRTDANVVNIFPQ